MQERETRPSELLYDAVACGMWLYVNRAFRIVVLGREHLRMRPGMIVASTHRSDADVPLLGSCLVFSDRMLFRHSLRPHYAARDDLWEPGILAALVPPSTPLPLRRLLFRLDISPFLARVRAHPLRISAEAQAVQALREVNPETPIDEVLPATLARRFRERGAAAVHEALRTEHTKLLWTDIDRHEIPEARALWQRRAQGAAADLRRLIGVVRSGEPLVIFPEGEPSLDGAIGPLRGGLDVLVRRGRPSGLLPIGIAYDLLTRGRPRVFVDVGEPVAPPWVDVEATVLNQLRKRTPLTCGQVVAHRLLAVADAGEQSLGRGDLDAALKVAVDEARSQGRGVEPSLVEADPRRRRLSDCLLALGRRGLVAAPKGGRLVIDRGKVGRDLVVRRAAVEYTSARTVVRAASTRLP